MSLGSQKIDRPNSDATLHAGRASVMSQSPLPEPSDSEAEDNGQGTDAQSVGQTQEATSGNVSNAGADAATPGTAAAQGNAAIVQAPEAQTLQVAPSEEEVGLGQTVLPNEDAAEATVPAEPSAVADLAATVGAAEGEAEGLLQGPDLADLLEEATKIMKMIRDSENYPRVSTIVEAYKW